MSVYVGPLFFTTPSKSWPYTSASHMTADTDEELHHVASLIGLKRSWAQHMEHPNQHMRHYDLTPNKRGLAVLHGAIEITMREEGRMILDERKAIDTR